MKGFICSENCNWIICYACFGADQRSLDVFWGRRRATDLEIEDREIRERTREEEERADRERIAMERREEQRENDLRIREAVADLAEMGFMEDDAERMLGEAMRILGLDVMGGNRRRVVEMTVGFLTNGQAAIEEAERERENGRHRIETVARVRAMERRERAADASRGAAASTEFSADPTSPSYSPPDPYHGIVDVFSDLMDLEDNATSARAAMDPIVIPRSVSTRMNQIVIGPFNADPHESHDAYIPSLRSATEAERRDPGLSAQLLAEPMVTLDDYRAGIDDPPPVPGAVSGGLETASAGSEAGAGTSSADAISASPVPVHSSHSPPVPPFDDVQDSLTIVASSPTRPTTASSRSITLRRTSPIRADANLHYGLGGPAASSDLNSDNDLAALNVELERELDIERSRQIAAQAASDIAGIAIASATAGATASSEVISLAASVQADVDSVSASAAALLSEEDSRSALSHSLRASVQKVSRMADNYSQAVRTGKRKAHRGRKGTDDDEEELFLSMNTEQRKIGEKMQRATRASNQAKSRPDVERTSSCVAMFHTISNTAFF